LLNNNYYYYKSLLYVDKYVKVLEMI
jgi:hypothetical protein